MIARISDKLKHLIRLDNFIKNAFMVAFIMSNIISIITLCKLLSEGKAPEQLLKIAVALLVAAAVLFVSKFIVHAICRAQDRKETHQIIKKLMEQGEDLDDDI